MMRFNCFRDLSLLHAIVLLLMKSSDAADECKAICAIANCEAPNASELCPDKCATNEDPKCNADFGFVADVSKSVENHWEDEKSFMKKLVQSIVMSEKGGRAAVTTFSNEAELQIKFSDHTSYSTFETALEAVPYVGSTTKIDLGLSVALEQMFKESNGMRSDVPQTMVLITDGQQTGVDFNKLRERFNNERIRTLIIGVGNVREHDLRLLVNNDADFYKADDFNELLTDEFIKSITFCGEFVGSLNSCQDKNMACQSWAASNGRLCTDPRYSWFVDPNGNYGCRKACGLC